MSVWFIWENKKSFLKRNNFLSFWIYLKAIKMKHFYLIHKLRNRLAFWRVNRIRSNKNLNSRLVITEPYLRFPRLNGEDCGQFFLNLASLPFLLLHSGINPCHGERDHGGFGIVITIHYTEAQALQSPFRLIPPAISRGEKESYWIGGQGKGTV